MYPREYFDTYWRPSLKNEVFVIMSFAPEFDAVWTTAIRPAIEEDIANHSFAHRVDATTLSGSIITEILDGIAHAKIIFADISVCSSGRWSGQRNGNAMYELGLAHALRPAAELVVVRCDSELINFDVSGIKIQSYERNDLIAARQIFAHLLKERLADLDQVKHLKTIQAVESLDADCLNLLIGAGCNDFFSVPAAKTNSMLIHRQAHTRITGRILGSRFLKNSECDDSR